MADSSESENQAEAATTLREQLAELVRRSLLQIGDMKALQDEMAKISKRITGLTDPLESKRKPTE